MVPLTTVSDSTWLLLRRLLSEIVQPYSLLLSLAVALMSVVAGTTALITYLLKPIVDQVFVAQNPNMLWSVGGLVFLAFFTKGLADFGQSALMSFISLRIVSNIQKQLFAHLMQMDIPFFSTTTSGYLISRFTSDVQLLRTALSSTLTSFGKDLLTISGLVVNMFLQDVPLAVISFLIFPAAVFPILKLGRRMRRVTAHAQDHVGSMITLLGQNFHGAYMVRAYEAEQYENNKADSVIETIFHLMLKAQLTRALSSPLIEMLGGIAITVVVIYGGWRVINGGTTAGALFSFLASLLIVYRPLKALANTHTSLQEGLASVQRLLSLLDIQPSVANVLGAKPLAVISDSIKFENITFTYKADIAVLRELSLDISAGSTVALVGLSGSGKTTLLNLILRFWDVDIGRITIDGINIKEVTLSSLRSQIALVSQEIVIFDDTVRANISYGKPSASFKEIKAAACYAAADLFISQLPSGYDTRVGERGITLSGGQKQRLAIARAVLKNAPILLLDEATSALDSESESYIQEALASLRKGRTTIIAAHRLSTVLNADIIHVLNQGRIVESGSHTELLERGNMYASLYRTKVLN